MSKNTKENNDGVVKKIYNCLACDVKFVRKYDWERHITTEKHKKNAKPDDISVLSVVWEESIQVEYDCSYCLFHTKIKNDWRRHLETNKHKINFEMEGKQNVKYRCKCCSKSYSNYKTYWAHNNKCMKLFHNEKNGNKTTMKDMFDRMNNIITSVPMAMNTNQHNNELMNYLIEQNKEFKELLLEQNNKILELVKSGTITTPNTITNNNTINGTINNNKFNITLFLNEKCKNAMNLSEFLDSIVVTKEDLENNARLGFVNGITKIIMDNIRRQDISERSIHCTDFKRETIYIKENDKWSKEGNVEKLNSAIQHVSTKSLKTLSEWQEENTEQEDNESIFNQNMILKGSIAGVDRTVLYPKVIKNIARETLIDKNFLM